MTSTILICLGFLGQASAADETPTPTPFPVQEPPPSGVPTGFDEAIVTPTPAATATPTPLEQVGMPPDHDEFFEEPRPTEGEWNPTKPFPGNYYALPLSLDVGWRPCLDCGGDVYSRPGVVTLWAGYAFQPYAVASSPYVAAGLEAAVASFDETATTWRGRWQVTPTIRSGWNFSAASVYAVGGVILPGEDRDEVGYHAGVGVSSFAFLAIAACTAQAIPSVIEVGADFVEDPELGRTRAQWALKIGWGF